VGSQEPDVPAWISDLPPQDLEFVRRFVLQSGSLNALAELYRISYPTIRQRLDRLIARLQTSENLADTDPLTRKIRGFVADGSIDPAVGKTLLTTYAQLKAEAAQ